MSMKNHINNLCRLAFMSLRKIGSIRSKLTEKATEALIHALITSRLDIGNGLLYGLPSSVIQKLQKVQNSAARLLSQKSRYEHINPILEDLHWLPVRQWISFKILLTTYKALNNKAPPYILDLFPLYNLVR